MKARMLPQALSSLRRLPALALCLPLAAAAGDDAAAQRSAFASVLALTRAGVAQTTEIEALRQYPLYPYLQAARLQRLVADAPGAPADGQVAEFLDANRGALWARDLRRAWLGSLADRGAWAVFLQYYDEALADPVLRCQQLVARLQTMPEGGADALRAAALARWLSADDQPDQCDAVFGWLKQQGALSDDVLEQRARLALKAGRVKLARALASSLPPARGEPLSRWAGLIQSPGAELEKLIARPDAAVSADALLDGFSRLARADGAAALKLYRPLLKTPAIGRARRVEFTHALALGLALDRQPEAIEYYRDLPEKELEDRDHEWRLRAAIWNGQWQLALKWLKKMPAPMAAQSRWRYWHARALDECGKPDEARKLYSDLADENGYHSVLAAQRLGGDFMPHNQPLADQPQVQARLAQSPALQRAREAAAVGEYPWVGAEWKSGVDGLTGDERLQAARLAAGWGLFEQAVTLTAQQQMFDDLDLLYPQPYAAEVDAGAALSGLAPPMIYSVMRQESLFRPDAVSSANAIGLLQLLPRYAREAARRWNLPQPSVEDLKKPPVNVPLGAAHLREYSDDFGGRFVFALAAYNAGPGALRRWLPDEPRDAEIWIENIPYNETRGYVQRVLWNLVVYSWRASGQPQNLRAHLAPVMKLPQGS